MIKKLLKIAFVGCTLIFVIVLFFVFWMRSGEDAPLDYSALAFELGPQDSATNGHTYLRRFLENNDPRIPDEYPIDFSEDYEMGLDRSAYENWDLDFFRGILEDNRDFMAGVEAAFERPQFVYDQEFTPQTILPYAGSLRIYVDLRLIESRVLFLSGQPEAALARLGDLSEELQRTTQSGGALIGLLTNVAMSGMLAHEFWVYQAHEAFSPDLLREMANNFTNADFFSDAVALSLRQEFQLTRIMIDGIADHTGWISWAFYGEAPSKVSLYLNDALLYVGFRKSRTLNEFFLLYSEVIQQMEGSVSERDFNYADSIKVSPDDRGWSRFLNRNPYGQVLLVILTPSIHAVLERVDLAKTSMRATQLSFALNAYYIENEALPEALDQLIPEYLPELPLDPFDGMPMRYSKDRKIVYSVGNDFKDDGGSRLPFILEAGEDVDDVAEHDMSEPTYLLGFVR